MNKQKPETQGTRSKVLNSVVLDGNGKSFYTHYDDKTASKALSNGVSSYSGHATSNYRNLDFDPRNIGGSGISGRYGFTNSDYESWRPGERTTFSNPSELMLACEFAYKQNGLIKNIIDLMGDFATQGIRIVHPNKKIEQFYRHWWLTINGQERSERFLNGLYKLGNVVIKVQTAKLNKTEKDRLYRTYAADIEVTKRKFAKNEIPYLYTFIHPATIQIYGGEIASFIKERKYGVMLPPNIRKLVTSPRNEEERYIVSQLPSEIRDAAKSNKPVPLKSDKIFTYHYKKDDWQTWADPLISSVLIDISIYEKLKLADRSALDGAIRNIRIFKIGNLEYKIAPTAAAAEKLSEILESNTSAGTLDLIWGPDIELIESESNVHQYLGIEKYEPHLLAIFGGLGIPPTLTGTFGASGTTNNFISLKTLMQRLKYGRDVLLSFWNEQVRIVQEAMGFRFPARIEFDIMNLGDETAEKALLIDLADRNIISDELIQRYFGSDPEMESLRLKREFRGRKSGRMIEKAGPYYDPNFDDSIKKLALQIGLVTPSEVGIELEPKKRGEKTVLDYQMDMQKKQTDSNNGGSQQPITDKKKKGIPGEGRPRNSNDKKKRKQKEFRPKSRASLLVWADSAQVKIASIINPLVLSQYGKSNLRELTEVESESLESLKFGVLCNIRPFEDLTEDSITQALTSAGITKAIENDLGQWQKVVINDIKRPLTLDEKKKIQSLVYAKQNY